MLFHLYSTLYGPRDCSLPGTSVHGDFLGNSTGMGCIPFSRGYCWPRNRTHISCIGRQIVYHWATREAQLQMKPLYLVVNHCSVWNQTYFVCRQIIKLCVLRKKKIEFLYNSSIVWILVVPKVLFSLVYALKFLQNRCWQELAYFEKDDCDVFNCLNLLSWGDWKNWKRVFLQSHFLHLDAYCLTVFAEDTYEPSTQFQQQLPRKYLGSYEVCKLTLAPQFQKTASRGEL